MRNYSTSPEGIESKSMLIIEEELGPKIEQFSPVEAAVVKRVIHTTADFEYADLLAASTGAYEKALELFSKGQQVIVTDTNMIAVGINRELLNSFDSQAKCLVAEEETRRLALEEGLTRSIVNIRRAAEAHPEAIFAIGNAPTALHELLRLAEEGQVKPGLVVGVPVGFVEAAESKEKLLKSNLTFIAVRGRKGGSTVAVAIINALMKLAAGK